MAAPNTSFPSIGEAFKFLFDVSGLLAQKHGQSEKLTDERLKKKRSNEIGPTC